MPNNIIVNSIYIYNLTIRTRVYYYSVSEWVSGWWLVDSTLLFVTVFVRLSVVVMLPVILQVILWYYDRKIIIARRLRCSIILVGTFKSFFTGRWKIFKNFPMTLYVFKGCKFIFTGRLKKFTIVTFSTNFLK